MAGLKLRSRNDAGGSSQGYYDNATSETVIQFNACVLDDDFINSAGAAVPSSAQAGYPWIKKIVGAGPPTVAVVANMAGGVMASTLTATSEKQDAALYAGDNLFVDATKGAIFESRLAMHVLPTSGTQMVWGLQSAWIDGPDNASFYLQFQALSSGLVAVRKKDGVATTSVSSGVTLVADVFKSFRIDCTDVANVLFLIDGAVVGKANFGATGANAVLQPYFAAYKASGTSVGTLYVDSAMTAVNRS